MTTSNPNDFLPHVLSPEDYVWHHQGQGRKVSDMTREDLMQALCQAMDTLDEVRAVSSRLTGVLSYMQGLEASSPSFG